MLFRSGRGLGNRTRALVTRELASSQRLFRIERAERPLAHAYDGEPRRIVAETADLWFHCLVLLARHGLGPADVIAELQRREGISGIDEKAARKPAAG